MGSIEGPIIDASLTGEQQPEPEEGVASPVSEGAVNSRATRTEARTYARDVSVGVVATGGVSKLLQQLSVQNSPK